jgi:hypothetical protein
MEEEKKKEEQSEEQEKCEEPRRRLSPYERTRAAVYATGNKWAIENFEATHN